MQNICLHHISLAVIFANEDATRPAPPPCLFAFFLAQRIAEDLPELLPVIVEIGQLLENGFVYLSN
jgi:hypothetical protein